jgi:hypothetical protein
MSRLLLMLTTFLLGGLLVVVAIVGIRSQTFVASEMVSGASALTQTPTSSAPTQAATATGTAMAQPAPVVTPAPADEPSRSSTPATAVQPEPVVKPALPAAAATDAQARIILVLPPRSQPYANRTLPPVRLVVPSIGVESRVIQLGTKYDKNGTLVWETPPFAVGHYRGTANPGAPGNVVLGGHISSPNEGSIVTLITCVPDGIYTQRLSVRAEAV